MFIIEDTTVTVKCRTSMKDMFLYLDLCISEMPNSLSCSFTFISLLNTCNIYLRMRSTRDRRGHGRMVVGFTTTCAIGIDHHWCCGLDSRSGLGVHQYVIKFLSALWQVSDFLVGPPFSSSNKPDRHDITEILLKVAGKPHQTNQPFSTISISVDVRVF